MDRGRQRQILNLTGNQFKWLFKTIIKYLHRFLIVLQIIQFTMHANDIYFEHKEADLMAVICRINYMA